MNSFSPKLKFYVAKNALFHFFHYRYLSADELSFLNFFYFPDISDSMTKLKLRLLCEENNDVIVASVLADSSFDEQKFLHYKYCSDFSFVKISMELHVHPNSLQHWRDKFLADISSLLNFNLPVKDVFSRNKLEALIFSLERLISFLESHSLSDEFLLNSLKMRLERYQDLLFAIRFFLLSDSSDLAHKIIRTKILFPNLSIQDFESYVGVSHTTIDKYLRSFSDSFVNSFIF